MSYIMRGSKKFYQRGSNFDNDLNKIFLVDEGREDPNTTMSELCADDGQKLNAGLVHVALRL